MAETKMRLLLVGASGGLGKLLEPILMESFDVFPRSSVTLNITDAQEVDDQVKSINPGILINLAVLSRDGLIGKTDPAEVHSVLDVNIHGNLNLMRSFINQKKEWGFGRYIYISSILSANPVTGASVYGASKAFNDNLIKTAAIENAKYGITFNSIQLGFFRAGLCDRLPETVKNDVLNRIPLRRFGKIEELANLIKCIIDTEYLTGANLRLAGGL